MKRIVAFLALVNLALFLTSCATGPGGTYGKKVAVSASTLRTNSVSALHTLYANNPKARALGQRAKAILVFPNITKGGFIAGGGFGRGTLMEGGRVTGYYEIAMASYGLQAGIQQYSLALMTLDDAALNALKRSDGWNIGSAPSLVVVDKGMAGSISVTTLQKGTYAFFFGQKGLMGGLGLEGSKITRIFPEKP